MALSRPLEMVRSIGATCIFSVFGVACSKDAPRTPEDLTRWSDESLWSIDVVNIEGEQQSLSNFAGKVALVVNVASACGFTPQYKDLQELYEERGSDDFVVLGFPCNDFGSQESGTETKIKEFCSVRYGVTFPMFEKIEIKNDEGRSDVYGLLGTQSGKLPGWNFCKYVVGRDGKVEAFFESTVSPSSPELQKAIDRALAQATPEGDS